VIVQYSYFRNKYAPEGFVLVTELLKDRQDWAVAGRASSWCPHFHAFVIFSEYIARDLAGLCQDYLTGDGNEKWTVAHHGLRGSLLCIDIEGNRGRNKDFKEGYAGSSSLGI
jgi:hypothetical protein